MYFTRIQVGSLATAKKKKKKKGKRERKPVGRKRRVIVLTQNKLISFGNVGVGNGGGVNARSSYLIITHTIFQTTQF